MTLGEKSLQVFRFVASFVAVKGYAPSYRQIGAACGLKSTSNVAYHLDKLAAAGYLWRDPYQVRAIVVLKELADDA
jgi:repressor LexA